jgi:hypothetical protein
MALLCLLTTLVPIILILGTFLGIDWIIRHARPK